MTRSGSYRTTKMRNMGYGWRYDDCLSIRPAPVFRGSAQGDDQRERVSTDSIGSTGSGHTKGMGEAGVISTSSKERKGYIPYMHVCNYELGNQAHTDSRFRRGVRRDLQAQGTGAELEGVCSPSIAWKRREEKEVTKNCLSISRKDQQAGLV